MKSLLVVLTLAFSAQTFASECSLPNKEAFISAENAICDENTNQVLLEGIKIQKFDEVKNVLINNNTKFSIYKTTNDICTLFGLGSPVSYKLKPIFSYLETGVEARIEYSYKDGAVNTKLLLLEKKQAYRLAPLKSIVCNIKE